MKKIIIEVIPHSRQRYNTCGDYFKDKQGNIHIKVSDMKNKDMENLVLVHELVELILCEKRGIKFETIDKFDIDFEKHHHKNIGLEPGDDIDSPYKNEHCFATSVERMLCAALGISWHEYELKVDGL